jgi:hypothetical protein
MASSTIIQDAAERVLEAFDFDKAYQQLLLAPNSSYKQAAIEQNRALKNILEAINITSFDNNCLNWDGGYSDTIYTSQQIVNAGGA